MMFMPLIFVVFCYNFAAALALYYTTQNLFTILQLYQNRKQPLPVLEKVNQPAKRKGNATMTSDDPNRTDAKELLDTMLGYLGFVVQIEETQQRGRQSDASDLYGGSRRLIGRDGETLDAIQFLLNRLIQAKDQRRAEVDRRLRNVSLDARRPDRAARARIGGARPDFRSSLQLEPMNSYERRIVHEAFKDDPEVGTWSPSDSARIKQITLIRRPAKKQAGVEQHAPTEHKG